MLIVVGGEKGGAGKSTIACNLAVCYAHQGVDVLLVDSDPQRTAARWAEGRAALDGPPSVRFQQLQCHDSGEGFFVALRDLRSRYGVVIVDVGGADTPAFRTAVACADMLISPVIPSECDTSTANVVGSVVQQVRAMGNRGLQAQWLLNQCSTHTHDDEAREAIEELLEAAPEMGVLSSRISHRKAFRRAYKLRFGVVELISASSDLRKLGEAASSEIWKLFEEVTGDNSEEATAH